MRRGDGLWISFITLIVVGGAGLLVPLLFSAPGLTPVPAGAWLITLFLLTMLVWAAQSWRVAVRGTRGDVSISMAIDVATMLLLHPFVAAAGSALGTGLYHSLGAPLGKEHRFQRALVRGILTFSAVALGGWLFHTLRPEEGRIIFEQDWMAMTAAIVLRLAIRVAFYPLGMAGLRPEPLLAQVQHEWNRLPVVPFILTTSMGGLGALVWLEQRWAVVLLVGPLVATWSATREFSRLNELLGTLEEKVADRTARLGQTVAALERRLGEFEALNAVDRAMAEMIHTDDVLTVIARESALVTGGTSALVTLLSDDGREQFIRAVHGESMTPFVGMELTTEGSLSGLVVQTGDVQISLNPPEDRRLNQALVAAGNWRCVIEAPLRAKDRVVGVLVVATHEEYFFDEQHLRLLSLLANQAGLFLQNSRLHQKERDVAVLEERNRLARELHDSVTQLLFSLTLNLEAAGSLVTQRPEKASSLITRSQEMASEALAEMRSLIFELRPAALQEKGLAMALTNHVNLFRRRQGVEVALTLEGEERLPPEMEFCLYRIAQEALNNVVKHAQATQVTITYRVSPAEASLTVQDNGVGFDPARGPGAESFGMLGMRERLESLGGTLRVESTPGSGALIEALLPLPGLQ